MSVITKGRIFTNGEQLTAEKLNDLLDDAAFNSSTAVDNSTTRVNAGGAITVKPLGVTSAELGSSAVTTAKIAASAVTTAKIANSTSTADGVTFVKMRRIKNMSVIGNVSGGQTTPSEITILDEDNMASNSATSLATQQSIKAYVDNGGGHSPTSYAGGESTTLPNGMIFKSGQVFVSSSTAATVTFGSAFPSGIVSVVATLIEDTNNDRHPPKIGTQSASAFTLRNTSVTDFYYNWIAIGY